MTEVRSVESKRTISKNACRFYGASMLLWWFVFWQNGENFEAYVGSNQSYHLIVYPNHTVELFYDN